MADYICNRCGCTFDENSAFYEEFQHYEIRPCCKEVFMTCPCCGAADYEDAAYCYKCGRPFRYGDLRGGYYCDECVTEMSTPDVEHKFCVEEADAFAEYLHELFGEEKP